MLSAASTSQTPSVVVGIDGSRTYGDTLDLAVVEAERRHAPLLVVHAWPGRYSGRWAANPMPTEQDGRHLLEIAERRARHRAPGLEVGTALVAGGAAGALAQQSAGAQLMVVGHRDDALTRHGWGSTAAYLAHHCACPLLVHRGAAPERGPVVVAVSARRSATATLACAFEEASLSMSRLVAVHVWTRPSARNAATRAAVSAGYAADRAAADRQLAEVMAGWAATCPDVEVERLVLHDLDVAYTLERASRRGRLLVAGIGRNGRFAELLYGSLGLAMMRTVACPVLLVPPQWQHPMIARAPLGPPATVD
ncbi:universal stress protein [Jidongwangia harbinensis]|uniref:universal stress protein n=1 Tax=Jidongwangia harbinensis TaxID=2878561 RepID=UPI001CDA09BB|nr:universal stress protein [Jidongwangia harbinensis]MCA2218991.1 universal stress protein [Jidongwangia harbinensis]